LEHRPKHSNRNASRLLDQHQNPVLHLPHIEELIEDGTITIGIMSPVGSVAVANQGRHTLAMLRRRKGETLTQLLIRLDLAIGKAFTEDVFTDEINT
jgi:hypothetical protein